MRLYILTAIVAGTICAAKGDCGNLVGTWTNTHGSEMTLNHDKTGLLTGTYTTAVEDGDGSAGTRTEHLVGAAPYDNPGATFGFSVMWLGGNSTTIWTGQCHMCDKQAVLMTSWLLRSKVNTCGDKWKAVQIGQDYFRLKSEVSSEHTQKEQVDVGIGKPILGDDFLGPNVHSLRLFHRRSAPIATELCEIPGVWYNDIGSKVELNHGGRGILKGDYWTGQEVKDGQLSGRHSEVYGQFNPTDHQHTMAYFLVWNKGESITGWVGQCHVCGEGTNQTEVLETTWFHRVAVTSCHANWKSTLYGQNSFTHAQQRPINPDDDMSGEFGEDVGLCPPSASSAGTISPVTALLMTAASLLHITNL